MAVPPPECNLGNLRAWSGTLGVSYDVPTISGKVTKYDGTPIANATVQLTGAASQSTSSAKDGTYAFSVGTGSYTVAVSGAGFFPASKTVSIVANDVTGVDFIQGFGVRVGIGNGGGTVTSSPPGINCGTACTHIFQDGTAAVLSATPRMGYSFDGWTGAGCSGKGTCVVSQGTPKGADGYVNESASFSSNDAVGKIVDIKQLKPDGPPPKLQYYNHGNWYDAYVGFDFHVGDTLRTNDNTVAAGEFVIGGRFGMNKSSEIEIVSEGNIKEHGKPVVKRMRIKQGGMWANVAKRTEPLEIQTNGGVIGIKG